MVALTKLYLPADLVAEWDGRHALHVDNAMNLEWWVQGGCEVFRHDYAAFCGDPLCAALEHQRLFLCVSGAPIRSESESQGNALANSH